MKTSVLAISCFYVRAIRFVLDFSKQLVSWFEPEQK